MVETGLVLVGFAALIAGLWWLSPAVALIVGGALVMASGIKLALSPARKRRRPHAARPTPGAAQ